MIEARNLCAGYGDKEVLDKVNVTLSKGEVTVIIGPNGCGKSTLLKTLVRIRQHSCGELRIAGRTIEALSTPELARLVAYLPQNKRAPDISALKMVLHGRFAYLSYPRKYRSQDMEIAKKALTWVGMEEKANERVSELSGGMQQKVYIAMALAQDTDTILMDEPTTYLDIAWQLRLIEMVKKLAARGKAVVMVLHDLSQALRIADKVIVMKEGRVVGEGAPLDIYNSGILSDVFGVTIERVEGSKGWHYLCNTPVNREKNKERENDAVSIFC